MTGTNGLTRIKLFRSLYLAKLRFSEKQWERASHGSLFCLGIDSMFT